MNKIFGLLFLFTFLTTSWSVIIFKDFCPNVIEEEGKKPEIENYYQIFNRIEDFKTENNIVVDPADYETIFLPDDATLNREFIPILHQQIVAATERGKYNHKKIYKENFVECIRIWYEIDGTLEDLAAGDVVLGNEGIEINGTQGKISYLSLIIFLSLIFVLI